MVANHREYPPLPLKRVTLGTKNKVFEDFLGHVAWKVSLEAALELAALKVTTVQNLFSKSCLDHKIDIDSINMDSAMQAFIPKSVLCGENIKPSALRRQFGQLLKKFSSLSPTESVLRSLSILIDIVKFDVEIFKASMGVGWSSPVDLLVGPEVGLSYRINERCEVGWSSPVDLLVGPEVGLSYRINERCESSRLAELRSVLEIVIKKMEQSSEKAILQLKISGTAQPMGSLPITVAVKVCKMENEPTDTQLILQESHLMKNLRHDNIISLIGVCMDAPMWLVMEMAPLGELRQYLQSNRASLSLTSLFLYSLQVARALAYLHERSLVHRDIAARNVLVSTPKCVKLTDFGLSRALDYDAIYTASRGKLPIKWLAPESINYREFSMASDIWMYGVCVWEILSWGAKPWQGVANADVITRVESGGRLPCPDGCPAVVFNYLELMDITSRLREMFAESTEVLSRMPEERRKEVELTESLIGNDMRQMGKVVQQVVDNINNPLRLLSVPKSYPKWAGDPPDKIRQ
ncbi:protein tyrosine kinase, partial [Teladorsagia circumcincta]